MCVVLCYIYKQKNSETRNMRPESRQDKRNQDETRQDETRQGQTDIYGHLRIINYEPGGHTAEKIIIGPADVFRTQLGKLIIGPADQKRTFS